MTDDTTTPKTVAELAQELAEARSRLTEARIAFDSADAFVKGTTAAEKAAYKAFNEAVSAMRNKRKPRVAKSAEPEAAT